ncbi:O-antigen ligase family protein [Candidatus Margulisiibacteriota bacterium]
MLPLFFTMPWQQNAFTLPKTLLLISLTTIIFAMVIIRKILVKENFNLPAPLKWPLLGMAGVAILATLFSPIKTLSFFGEYWIGEGLLTFLTYLALFFLALQIINDEQKLWKLLQFAYLAGLIMTLFGFLEMWFLTPEGYFNIAQPGMTSTTGFKNYTAAYLSMAIVIGWGMLLKYWTDKRLKILMILAQAILIFGLIFSQGRAGFLGFLLGSGLLGIMLFRKFDLRKLGKVIIITLLITLFILLIFGPQIKLIERFKNTPLSSDPRLLLWSSAIDIFRANPVLGIGFNSYKYFYPRYAPNYGVNVFYNPDAEGFSVWQRLAHNEFLDILSAQGPLGLLAYCWFLILLFRTGYTWFSQKSENERLLPAILLSAVAAYLINQQLGFGNVSYTPLFWVMAASLFLTATPENNELPSPEWSPLLKTQLAGIILIVILVLTYTTRAYLAENHYHQGMMAIAAGYNIEAVRELNSAVRLNRSSNYYQSDLAAAYRLNNELPRAITIYQESLLKNPYDVTQIFNLAMVHKKQGDIAQADSYLQQALALDSYFQEANYSRLNIALNDVQEDLKARKYKKAVADGLQLMDQLNQSSVRIVNLDQNYKGSPYTFKYRDHLLDIFSSKKLLTSLTDPFNIPGNYRTSLKNILKLNSNKLNALELPTGDRKVLSTVADKVLYHKYYTKRRFYLLRFLKQAYLARGLTTQANYCTQLINKLESAYNQ